MSARLVFTFQSGDIQILNVDGLSLQTKDTLHSNLVIFKFKQKDRKGNELYIFTFQSGDIQIINAIKPFTFATNLYIPIW